MSLRSICLLAIVALGLIANSEAKCPGGRAGCPKYQSVHTLLPEAELRRYNGGIWVAREAPPDTFTYTCEFSNFYLGDYFRGANYGGQVFNLTTPLLINVNVWDMRAKREARFFVQDAKSGRVSPPIVPNMLITEPERWYYVREMKQSMDFTLIMHETFKMMADLVVERQPFDHNKIHLAMYNYPKDFGKPFTGPNEIWVEKPKTDAPPFNGEEMMSAEELYALANSWLHHPKEQESVFDPYALEEAKMLPQ